MTNKIVGKESGDYRTIQSAVDASSTGDTVFIFPGTYNERVTISNKYVNLIGMPGNPIRNEEVLIYNSGYPLYIHNTANSPSEMQTIHIEGLHLKSSSSSYGTCNVYGSQNASGIRPDIILNKCILENTAREVIRISYSKQFFGNISLQNCRLIWITYISYDMRYCASFNLMKCIIGTKQSSFYYYGPAISDYVLYEQHGYGPNFGEYITTPINQYYIHGTITEHDIPVEREVALFDRDTGVYIKSIVSNDTDGYYYATTTHSGEHFMVCLDDLSIPNYNNLIRSNIIPKLIT